MMKAMSSGVDMALASSVQRQQRAEHVEGQFAQQEREIQQRDRHDDARDHHLLLPSNQGASNQGASNRDRGRGRPSSGSRSTAPRRRARNRRHATRSTPGSSETGCEGRIYTPIPGGPSGEERGGGKEGGW